MNGYICIKVKGNSTACNICLIKHRCNEFVENLQKLYYRKDLKGLLSEDIEDIISKTAADVLMYKEPIKNLEAFIKYIFKMKKAEFFRGIYKKKSKDKVDNSQLNIDETNKKMEYVELDENIIDDKNDTNISDENRYHQQIIDKLKSLVHKDKTKCVKFFLDYYLFCLSKDISDNECATKMGLISNTFTVKKKRCREIISKMFKNRGIE